MSLVSQLDMNVSFKHILHEFSEKNGQGWGYPKIRFSMVAVVCPVQHKGTTTKIKVNHGDFPNAWGKKASTLCQFKEMVI